MPQWQPGSIYKCWGRLGFYFFWLSHCFYAAKIAKNIDVQAISGSVMHSGQARAALNKTAAPNLRVFQRMKMLREAAFCAGSIDMVKIAIPAAGMNAGQ